MHKKILIVEDEPVLREMYQHKFEQEGFAVLTANDGDEGMVAIQQESPDLILLDILLPKENGIGLLKKIKADDALSKIKVVAFSNFDDPTTKGTAWGLGVVDYLIKTNYTPGEVVERVKGHLLS